ncbi:hypothetical protein N780_17565 [Pontibacillus chungwhensis BH030062]|uniref:Uncharacterized protein n=1 Tax=Pontibacillus chungwhensis BH030062 TaxID=1385513 RepID=A0A0A2VBL0_9BACI|nr:hypothetical protein [Pontibacillus chungwhensis]KGP91065.1 hypothetical protein N780_17565 [Pontibacillus chungwhensis BH030062]
MFGFAGVIKLILSAFIILPVVSIIREGGYLIASYLLGASSSKVTVGCGPKVFNLGVFEVRRYYFMYSWCSYDTLKFDKKWAHIVIYSAPILSNVVVAIGVNALLAIDGIPMESFWTQFIFYAFYFVLFDFLPVYYPDGQPSNGRVIYDLIRHNKFPDFEKEGE